MPGMIDRLQENAEEKRKVYIPLYIKHEKEQGKGYSNSSFCHAYRYIAVADYVAHRDAAAFRATLKKALSYRLALYEAPEDAPEKRFWNRDFYEIRYIMDSLALGDLEFSTKMMRFNEAPLEKKAHPFIKRLHGLLQGALLKGFANYPEILEEVIEHWGKREKSYLGYAQGFKAIHEKESATFVEALTLIMKGHKRLCHPAGEWGGTEDEVIAIWPLGLANLARMKGLTFDFDHPLLPADLILPGASS